jgi:hypothetical protein
VTLTRSDVRLLEALASLAEHVPEMMRAGHLAERARELAERLEAFTPRAGQTPPNEGSEG